MESAKILVIGGGIGGLTSAIALGRRGFDVEIIERDPDWSVYGVGIIQQSNVVRAMAELDVLDSYLDRAFGFDHVEIYLPSGERVARVRSPTLAEGYPANVGISRRALHEVLGDKAMAAGAKIRLGVVATAFDDDGEGVSVRFGDGSAGRYDVVIGADGVNSATRAMILPEAPAPEYVGQSVWRYNFPRQPDLDCLRATQGATGIGLVPLSDDLMYVYVTTPEPGNPRYPRQGLAAAMRARLAGASEAIRALAERIVDDEAVVYKPLECLFLTGDWHKGRIVLLGDAVHTTTPHLGQGAGMAIEDGLVLADELARAATPEEAFRSYRARRFGRCAYIVSASRAICDSQLGKAPPVDYARATQQMFEAVSAPI